LRRAWTVPRVGLLALGGEFPSPPTCGHSCRAVSLPLLRYNDGRAWSSSQTKTRGVFRGSGLCPDGVRGYPPTHDLLASHKCALIYIGVHYIIGEF
ncbi:MAG: hypothetical protein H7707_06090, partial [Acetobacter sp.]|nr:hypothetical protein [Acetobacter sp.]